MTKNNSSYDVTPQAGWMRQCFLFCVLILPSWAQTTLQITSPTTGTVVAPGNSVTVTVAASGETPQGVLIAASDPIGFSDEVDAAPFQFTIQLPNAIDPGLYVFTADGWTASGNPVTTDAIRIDIERSDSPVSLNAAPSSLSALAVGDQTAIRVMGTYADGSVVDLTNSTRTTFATNPTGIVTVGAGGLVTAVGSGSAQIVVNGSLSVPVTVDPPITIAPAQATLTASQTRQFISVVSNPANPAVTWQLNPPLGTIATDGLYTAPASLSAAQTTTLTATSVADPTLTASAQITLSAAVSLNVLPAYAVLYAAQPQKFTAITSNAGTAGVNWSVSPTGAGTIDSTGLYTAPAPISSVQGVTITATSVSNPSISGSTTIYISPQPFALLLYPPTLGLGPGLYNGTSVTILTNGFTHPLTYSVTGLPNGVTAAFNAAQTVLTFTASPTVVQGTYTVNVTANDTVYPPLSQTQPITLTIGGGFSLAVSSPTVTTIPGGSVGVTVTQSVTSGFNTPILWQTSAGSSGIAATFPSVGISWQQAGPGSTTLLLTVPGGTAPGSYPIAITGSSRGGGGTFSATMTLVVQAQTGPSIVSMYPNPGTQTTQLLTFAYSDPIGVASITSAGVLVNATPSTASACYVQYSPSTQTLSLGNDAGTGWAGSAAIGAVGTLRNSQCILDTGASQAAISGNELLLTLVLTPVNPVVGIQSVFGSASDSFSSSGWLQVGVWTISANSLPSPWRDQDVGGPAPNGPGLATYTPATGDFQIFGTSNDPNSTPDPANDWFRYVYQPLAGNGTIVAQMVDLNNVFQYTNAGLMIRATPAQNSPFVYLSLQPNNGGCTISYRSTTGAALNSSPCNSNASPPVWMMLTRLGSTFSLQTSPDGLNWTSAGAAVNVSLPVNVQVGMAVASNLDGNVSWADFENVSVTATASTPVATPTFSPAGGTYTAGQTVTLSTTTSGALIRYTTDGSTPTETAGTLYSGPFKVSTITTIKAIAYAPGMTDSAVASAAYVFNPTVTFTGAPASAAYQSTFTVATTTNASTTATITASGPCSVAGAVVTMTGASGTCLLTANWPADLNYLAASMTQSTVATKATATVALTAASLTQTYSGTAKSVTSNTTPVGLTVNITYGGSATPPVNAGSYAVVGTVNDSNYQGSATGTLLVNQAALTVTANNASRVFGAANSAFSASYTGFVGTDTLATAVTGSPSLTTKATTTSLPGVYPIAAAPGTLASANYAFTLVNGTLTVTATAASPSSGTTCNGAYTGTFSGNVTVSSGQNCVFVSGGVSGNMTLSGASTLNNATVGGDITGQGALTLTGTARVNGNVTLTGGQLSAGNGTTMAHNVTLSGGASLTLGSATVGGDLTMNGGGGFSIGPSATIGGNVTIQSEPSSAAQSQVCGATVKGNLTLQSDGGPVQLGSTTPANCGGNTIGGNMTIQQNTAAVGVFNNLIGGNLSCQNNTSITGSGNKATQKQGQCAGF